MNQRANNSSNLIRDSYTLISDFFRFAFGSIVSREFLIIAVPLVAAWEILPRLGVVPRTLFPTLVDVLAAGADLALHHSLLFHYSSSIITLGLGLICAIVTAIPIGTAMGWNRVIRQHALPFFQILAPIPPPAWVPITIILFGIGLPMKVFLVFTGAFYPILFNTLQTVKDTDPRYLAAARIYGASEFTLITHVYIRHSLSGIIMSVRTGIALGLIMLTIAEMYGDRSGIGFLLVESKEFFRIPAMIACMGILGGTGWMLTEVLKYAERRLSRWKADGDTA
jgi:ABC-type nitrate/sulfonate/bicarbonate transport system permease component